MDCRVWSWGIYRFNRNIMGCKYETSYITLEVDNRFNRNIMGCK